jgi:hypothetical protein
MQRSQQRRTAPATLCALLIASFVLFTAGAAHAGSITIEWDRSVDPEVIGYQVSVGTTPGVYTETFDVGPATSFVYEASDSRVYYLAVASYAAGRRVGPLSPPVSAAADARAFFESLWRNSAAPVGAGLRFNGAEPESVIPRVLKTGERTSVPATVCWITSHRLPGSQNHHPPQRGDHVACCQRRWPAVLHRGTSADCPDRLRRPAAAAGSRPRSAAVHFDQVQLDSSFVTSGLLYVGETETFAEMAAGSSGSSDIVSLGIRPLTGLSSPPSRFPSRAGRSSRSRQSVTSMSPSLTGRSNRRILKARYCGSMSTEPFRKDPPARFRRHRHASPHRPRRWRSTSRSRAWLAAVDASSQALLASLDGLVAPWRRRLCR